MGVLLLLPAAVLHAAGYNMQVTFTNFAGKGTLTNFPALIQLTTNNTDTYTGFIDTTSGWDLRFWTNSALTGTELNYEIESFGITTNSYIWVQVPELSHETSIWISWGDTAASNQQSYTTNGAVWSEGFGGVWHLKDDVLDSTSNDNDGTKAGSTETDGMIGRGQLFDGTGDDINCGNGASLKNANTITASGWMRASSISQWAGIIGRGNDRDYELEYNSGSQMRFRVDNDSGQAPTANVSLNTWYYMVGTYGDGANVVKIYQDGVLINTRSTAAIADRTENLWVGSRGGGSEHVGEIDEARVSTVARASNWVWACWMNQGANHDSFSEYGVVGPSKEIFNAAASDITTTSVTFNATLFAANTNYDAYVYWWPEGGTTNSAHVGGWTNVASTNITYTNITLLSGTHYYYTHRATNDYTNVWATGNQSFWTLGAPGVDTVSGATGIGIDEATLNGQVASTGGVALTHVRIYFGDDDGGATTSWDTNYVFSVGSVTEGVPFSVDVSNLLYGVQYSYRTYASNSYGENWSTVASFTTLPPEASLVPPVTANLTAHYDAGVGVTASGGVVSQWADQSGNGFTATQTLGTLTLISNQVNGLPVVHFADSTYANIAGSLFSKQQYVVFSLPNQGDWGAVLGSQIQSGYLMNRAGNFWGSNYPDAVRQNGGAELSPAYQLSSIGNFMVVRITGNDNNTSVRSGWALGRQQGWGRLVMDLAEVISYDTALSAPDEDLVGGYLAYKYGITTAYSVYSPPAGLGITTDPATTIMDTSATLTGVLDAPQTVFATYLYWSTTVNTDESEWLADGSASSVLVGSYTNVTEHAIAKNITGLSQGSTYYYTFMATNISTNIWAATTNFVADGAPVVENGAATAYIGHADLSGNVIATNGGPTIAMVFWGLTDGGTDPTAWDSTNVLGVTGIGPFSTSVNGLQFHADYFYRCYVTNGYGEHWAASSVAFVQYQPVYVDADASGANDGSTWTDAYTTFQSGLTGVSAKSNTIWIAEGTYSGVTFQPSVDTTAVYGGFNGTETSMLERDWDAQEVVLDGQGSRRVMEVKALDVILDGLVITNGYISSGDGAGIVVDDGVANAANLTMANCRIVDNLNYDMDNIGGGAYFLNAGAVVLTNCTIQGNQQRRGNGSGLYSRGSTLTLLDCQIRGNWDANSDYRSGHGFYLYDGTLTMVRSTVADNTSPWDDDSGDGAGGYIRAGTASFTNCLFSGNNIKRGKGGGLYISSGDVTIENCTFADNGGRTDSATPRGGAIYNNGATLSVKNSIFWNNQIGNTATDGDAIYNGGGTLTISYCSFGEGLDSPRIQLMGGTLNWGTGNFTNDPIFVSSSDYHLQSTIGHWDGSGWVADSSHSPCIDLGDGTSDYSLEPFNADGGRINLGAYGGLAVASKSGTLTQPVVKTLTADVFVDKARLHGELMIGSVSDITFYYGLTDATTNAASWDNSVTVTAAQLPGTVFEADIIGLDTNETYWFTVFASNDAGSAWGISDSFLTGSVLPVGGGPTILHVDADAVGFNDGSSWTNAYTQLADAIDTAAGTAMTVWVAEGSYSHWNAFAPATNGLSIYGGFDGTETLLSERDWTNNVVVLDGQDTRRVVDIQADDILLDGLIITNGYISVGDGAGLRMNNSPQNLTLANSKIAGCYNTDMDDEGGGAYFYNAGTVLITNSVIQGNRQHRGYGSGFYSRGTTLTFMDSELRGNHDGHTDYRSGHGFYLYDGTLTMVRSTVADNTSPWDDDGADGAGGYIRAGTASFTNCLFTGNNIKRGEGGGLYISSGNVTIENCTFADNGGRTDSATPNGGAIYVNNGTVSIVNSIFWDNQTGNDAADGDTIYVNAGTVSIEYSCLDGIDSPRVFGGVTLGDGIITNNPLFATDYTDLHLKSSVGRWDGSGWVTDATNSLCIDGGRPDMDYSEEPAGENGLAVNMGAYGNTWKASKSANTAPVIETLAVEVYGDSVRLRGQLTAGAAADVTFYYGLTNEGEVPAAWDATNVFALPQTSSRILLSSATGLTASVTYWFIAYASNAYGNDWSSPISFTTGATPLGGGPGVIHVDADATGGLKSGADWMNAYVSLDNALAAAKAGEGTNIWIANGDYVGVSTFLVETNDLEIYGGFTGVETSRPTRDWASNEVRLNGQGLRRVIEVKAHNVILDGLTITNGYVSSGNGAGLLIDDGTTIATNLTLVNCSLVGNSNTDLDNYGGGAYFYNAGSVVVTNCMFADNHMVRGSGAGFYSRATTLMVIDCELRDNWDTYSDNRYGHGFYLYDGTLTMVGTTVADNSPPSDDDTCRGAGGYIRTGTAAFTNCVFTGNYIWRGRGGGLYIEGSGANVTIESCTFAGNGGRTDSATPNGGAIYMLNGTVTITNTIFWGNQIGNDAADGDTIYQAAGTLDIGYTCIDGTNSPRVQVAGGTLTWGDGMSTNDPIFVAEYTDVHLRSSFGRWTSSGLTYDFLTSPLIDVGDPTSLYGDEPDSPAGQINMGAYGNTVQASYGVVNAAPVISQDIGAIIEVGTATFRGTLMSTGNLPTEVWTHWGTTDGGTDTNLWDTRFTNITFDVDGVFSSVPSNVNYGVDYYYRVVASNSLGMTWAASSTLVRLLMPGEPVGGGGISFFAIDGDATSEIDSSKVYTHAIDFGSQPAGGGIATINGVVFADGSPGDFPAIGGSSQTVGTGWSGYPNTHSGNTDADAYLVDGGMEDLVHDMIYNVNDAEIRIEGLTPLRNYQFRLYHRVWGVSAGDRRETIDFDTDGLAGAEDSGAFNEADATYPDANLASAFQVNALTYDYNLAAGVTTLTVNIDYVSGRYHLYGLSNEERSGVLGVTNVYMTNVLETSAYFNGDYVGTSSVFNVWVYYGLSDAGATTVGWDSSSFVGAYTNVEAALLSEQVTALTADTIYYGRFYSLTPNSVTSFWSDVVSFGTAFSADDAPSNLTATATAASIEINWQAHTVDSETGFVIERSPTDASSFTFLDLVGSDVTNYVDGLGLGGITYYYRVAATNVSGLSIWSNNDNALMPVLPADIYVTTNGVHATGPSWGSPTSFTNALAIATANQIIWMTEGSYTNATTHTMTTAGVEIYGGFELGGYALTNRDLVANETLIDGEGARRLFTIQANDIIMDGVTITNGYIADGQGSGAAILMNNTANNLTLANCRIMKSRSFDYDAYGGAMYFYNAGSVLITNCYFQGNQARRAGGSLFYTRGTTLTFRDCELRENYDMHNDNRPAPGAFYMYDGTLTMVGVTIADNTPGSNAGSGAGGYVRDGTASFTNCVFSDNITSYRNGGGLYIERSGANVMIDGCTFVGNGGRTDSSSPKGGAIYQADGTVTIQNSIFWDNQTGNTGTDGDTIYQANGTLNISYTCMDGTGLPRVRYSSGAWGDGIITNNPLFATDYTDLHLQSTVGRWDGTSWVTDGASSPCIDAGDPASDYSNEPTGENGARVNLGAYGHTSLASKSLDAAPTVETRAETVSATAAALNGELTAGAVSTITFYYGLTDGGTTPVNWDATNVLAVGQPVGDIFSSIAGNLQASQTYWFTVYASNAFGNDWGTSRSFVTGAAGAGGGPAVLHVDADAVGVPDGLSWANAFTSFDAALVATAGGLYTNVWVAEGSYSDINTYVIETNGIGIYGGFTGVESSRSSRDWENNVVLFDGEATRRVFDLLADDIIMDGVTITNGYVPDGKGSGVAIRMNNTANNLTLANCRIMRNRSFDYDAYGGGMYFYNAGSVLITNCYFQGNQARRAGGSLFYSRGTTLTFRDCELRENYDMHNDNRPAPGAFYHYDGTLTMVGVTIADNTPAANAGSGAGGYVRDGTASFTNCVFSGNITPLRNGGGLYIERSGANVMIDACTFVGNGGRTDSSSPSGGAIYQANGTVTIQNSIFWDNQTGNDANDGDTIYQAAGTLNISYTCMDGTTLPRVRYFNGTWGDGIITNNPLFATDYTDLHLKSMVGRWNGSSWVTDTTNSPCIDAGDPASDFSNEPTGENGARVNMGAYGHTAYASKSLDQIPVVETVAERVVATSAEIRGELTAGAVSTITFYYGLTDGGQTPTSWDATNVLTIGQSVGPIFSSVASKLQASQTYWFTVHASNAFGSDWGTPRSFVTGNAAVGGGTDVIHVDADAGGVTDGTSWTNAFTTFTEALAAADAGSGTNIWLAEGRYTGAGTFIIATNGLEIYGGFAGTETDLTNRNWTNNEVVFDGEATRRLFTLQADDIVFDGVTITNGYMPDNLGGGTAIRMYNSPQNLTLANCRIMDNKHYDYEAGGGALYLYNAGTVLITNCYFQGNQARRGYGSAFYTRGTTLTIMDTEFRENYDLHNDLRNAPGTFYMYDGTLTMVGTTIADSTPYDDTGGPGAGGYIRDGVASFTNCVFSGNITPRSHGGGLYIERSGANVMIDNCTFANNGGRTDDATPNGGAIYQANGTVTIRNSIFWDNQTGNDANDGDTIYQAAGTMDISYTCIDGTNLPRVRVGGTLTWGSGMITNNPIFATDYTDVHLESEYGRWFAGNTVFDITNSPCIDAGDPASDFSSEASPNGGRINIGAYGNTAQASLSQHPVVISTLNGATNIAWTNATLMGELVYTNMSPSYAWFYYGTSNATTNKASWDSSVVLGVTEVGVFSNVVIALLPDTTYWYTAYGSNTSGEAWAAVPRSFTTFDAAAVNNGSGASLTRVGEALVGGNLVSGGQCDVTVYWGLSDGGASAAGWQYTNTISAVDEGAFSTNLTGLLYGHIYYYRSYATNQLGDAWAGSTESFAPLKFPVLTVTNTLELWLAADDIDGDGDTGNNPADGVAIDTWYDKSGNSRDAIREGTDQTSYNTNGVNGKPVVHFDSDYMYTTYNFDSLSEYTVFMVAHYDTGGTHERILSSRTRDWRFGYDGADDEEWYAQGTIHGTGTDNTDWHIHAGHINSEADPKASFWKDGVLLTSTDTGSDNTNYKPGQLGLGGYRTNNDESNCEIAEVLIFGRVLSSDELDEVGAYLEGKYNLSTAYDGAMDLTSLAIDNQAASDVQETTAVINADLTATGAVLDVWAYWGPVNGGEVPGAWESSTFVGSYSNIDGSISYMVSDLLASSSYYFNFRATNQFEDLWGSLPVYGFTSLAVGSQVIANGAAQAVTNHSAIASAALQIPFATYAVYLHWGTADGSNSVGSWANSYDMGVYTNVVYTNLTYLLTGLSDNVTNWYTFRVSNAVSTIWAAPSSEFVTPKDETAKGTIFNFR